jgi:hypothetical protein
MICSSLCAGNQQTDSQGIPWEHTGENRPKPQVHAAWGAASEPNCDMEARIQVRNDCNLLLAIDVLCAKSHCNDLCARCHELTSDLVVFCTAREERALLGERRVQRADAEGSEW